MLIIHSVNPTGLFSYGYNSTISLDFSGLVNLVGINRDKGGSNGSGKTSLFNSICEVLFGDNPTGVSGPGAVNHVWGKGCCARVEFTSWGNKRYRITLSRDCKESPYQVDADIQYTGTGLFFECLSSANTWEDCRGAGILDTRKKVIEAIGMSYNRFISIAYMAPRLGNKFLRGTNKDRMEVLAGITQVDDWDFVLARARDRKNSLEADIKSKESAINFESGRLSSTEHQLSILQEHNWQDTATAYEENIFKHDEIIKKHRKALEATEVVEMPKNADLGQVHTNIIVKEQEKLKGVVAASMPSDSEIHKEYLALSEARSRLDLYKNDSLVGVDKCPLCNSSITKAKKEKTSKHLSKLNNELVEAQKVYDAAVEGLNKKKLEVQKQNANLVEENTKRVADIDVEIQVLREYYTSLQESYNEQVKKYQQYTSWKHSIDKEIADIEVHKKNASFYLNQARENINKISQLNIEIQGIKNQLSELSETLKSWAATQNYYIWLIGNIPYIKLHILSTSMEVLSDNINKCLYEMGDTIVVEIKAFEERKVKDAGDFTELLRSEVNVSISDGDKEIDPRLYSEGELGKISNAFVRAFRKLSLMNGKGCNLLLLDEMFSFVDYDNSQKIADSFVSEAKEGVVIITDNSNRAKDLLDFDYTWNAIKTNNITVLS